MKHKALGLCPLSCILSFSNKFMKWTRYKTSKINHLPFQNKLKSFDLSLLAFYFTILTKWEESTPTCSNVTKSLNKFDIQSYPNERISLGNLLQAFLLIWKFTFLYLSKQRLNKATLSYIKTLLSWPYL